MTRDTQELNDRKRRLLKAIVEVHIRRGEPVGSKFLIQDKQFTLSSATIRNEMAELEQMGYLEQPHTSAGRIPSKKGYRLYVDALMNRYRLTPAESEQLDWVRGYKQGDPDQILGDASKILSRLTGFTSMAIRTRPDEWTVRRFDTLLSDPYRFLLIMTTSTGEIRTKSLRLTVPIDNRILRRLTALLNESIAGVELSEITMQQILLMERKMGVYNNLINPIVKCVFAAMRETGDIRFEGINRLLQYPEYRDSERIRQLFDLFDSKEEILSIVESAPAGRVHVTIGSDTGVDAIDNSTVVFRTVANKGKTIGAIGILGPCRMDYERIVTLVDAAARTVTETISDSGERLRLPDAPSQR